MNNSTLNSILRSNDVRALHKWFEVLEMPPKTIYELLGGGYEELNLKNVPLSSEMRFEVEWKLSELQFAAMNPATPTSSFKSFKATKLHLDLTCQHIENFLCTYWQPTLKPNLSFILDAKFVALHVSVLKRRLPFTYEKIPWEEIEFLMVIFILTLTKTSEIDLTCDLLVDDTIIRSQLKNFLNELKEIQNWFLREHLDKSKSDAGRLNAVNNELRRLHIKGQSGRRWDTQVILNNSPEFDDLYKKFYIVRDIYSLNQIQHYLNIAIAVDLNSDFLIGSLVIQRTLQIIGEYLNNEKDSPNISADLYPILVKLVPKKLRDTMKSLRNTLSHSHGLNKRLEIEEFSYVEKFTNIQLELKTINGEISRVLYQRKIEGLIMFLQKINCNSNIEKAQSLFSQLDIDSRLGTLQGNDILNLNHIKTLVDNFWKEVKDQITDHSKIDDIYYVLSKSETHIQEAVTTYNSTVKHIKHVLALRDTTTIQNLCRTYLGLLKNREIDGIFEEMFGLLHEIYLAYKTSRGFAPLDTKVTDQKLINITKIIQYIHETLKWNLNSIRWIESIHLELQGEQINCDYYERAVDKWFEDIKNRLNATEEKTGDTFYDAVLNQRTKHNIKTMLFNKRNDSDFLDILNTEDANELLEPELTRRLLTSHRKGKAADLQTRITQIPDSYGLLIRKLNEGKLMNLPKHIEYFNDFLSKIQIQKGAKLIAAAKSLIQEVVVEDIKKDYSRRLLTLKSIYMQTNSFKLHDINETLIVSLEMLLLDLMECLDQVGCLQDNVTFLVDKIPILAGKQLRNHLAHGNITTCILPYNSLIPLLVYATGLINIPEDELIALDTRWCLGLKFHWDSEDLVDYMDRCQKIAKQQDILFSSVEKRCSEATIEAIKAGADIYATDLTSNTALDIAILNADKDFVTVMLSHIVEDADVLRLINPKNTVKCFEIFKYLLEHTRLDVHSIFENNKTLLHLAAEVGQRETVQYLVENMVNVKCRTSYHESVVHLASKNGFLDIILLILDHWDFDLDDKISTNNATSLHLAIENGHFDVVDELVKRKASFFLKTADDLTPLQVAIRTGNEDIVGLLFRNCEENMSMEEKIDSLLLATKYGLTNTVLMMLKNGIDVDSKNSDGVSALYTAAAFGQANITSVLLSEGANVNLEHQTGVTALHIACRFSQLDVVVALLRYSANINARDNADQTPLHFAFVNNNLDIIKLLLSYSAIITAPFDINGMTPYHAAAEIGATEAIEHFIKMFPEDINIPTKEKRESALHLAAGKGLLSTVHLLLNHNADVNCLTIGHAAPLHFAIQRHGYNEIVDALIKKGAHVNSQSRDGAAPLHVAVLNQNEDILDILLSNGADVLVSNNTKYTPLHMACMNPSVNIVEKLILKVKNVNMTDDNESTPLHHAASGGFLDSVRLLLDKEADYNHVNLQKNGALHFAAYNGHLEIVELLVARGAIIDALNTTNVSPILMAIQQLHEEVVMFLHRKGAVIAESTNKIFTGATLLIKSLNERKPNIASLLLDIENIFIDVHATTTSGATALHLACGNGYTDCTGKILRLCPDINAKTKNGLTPLHFAAKGGHEDIVKQLLLAGVLVDEIADIPYPTALCCAVLYGNEEVVKILLENKADVNVRCLHSTTPLHLAILRGYTEIAKLILKCKTTIVNMSTDDNSNILHFVALAGNTEVMSLLLGFNLKNVINAALTTNGETPLHCAVRTRHADIVSILLKIGADISLKDANGLTVKESAIRLEFEDIVQLFENRNS